MFEYSDVKTTVENYKFKGHKYLSASIGTVMFTYLKRFYPDILSKCDILCPVPIHSTRLEERGYDQSALIGRIISEKSGIEYKDMLVRVRPTGPQSLIKGLNNREANVKGAFIAGQDAMSKTVLLIDDVITTGKSAISVVEALRNGKNGKKAEVLGVYSVFDWEFPEVNAEFKAKGIEKRNLVTIDSLFKYGVENGLLDVDVEKRLREFYQEQCK